MWMSTRTGVCVYVCGGGGQQAQCSQTTSRDYIQKSAKQSLLLNCADGEYVK